uniref:Trichome birefringence-like C-terminal domain-containing protein n=1 Tax=Ananas comosus var. bracteatus TaxID=296719 RepID=A0A6V7PQB9_ANACO|nr:unnamed protein product [Ananas comosus var. bracteatus]
MKVPRGKLPLSVIAVLISGFALAGLIFTEDLRALTGTSILKLKACCKQDEIVHSSNVTKEEREKSVLGDDIIDEDKISFHPGECNAMNGKWVFNRDKDLLFNPRIVLEKLRGKRLMFVGDSLQREQWQSFVCMVESILPHEGKSMNRSRSLSVFTAKEYNATIEFYWAPFLIQSNSDAHLITNTSQRILHVDSITKHAQHWIGVDILIFDTYVWWMSGQKIKSVWGSFANGDEGFEELDFVVAYRIGLKTWANWIDSTIDPNSTRVFFTTMSPTHMRSKDWHNEKGIRCYNETRPVMERGYWGSGSDRRIMGVVTSVIGRMKVPVTFLNITQLTEYRIDGHVSVHTESKGKILSDEKKGIREFTPIASTGAYREYPIHGINFSMLICEKQCNGEKKKKKRNSIQSSL